MYRFWLSQKKVAKGTQRVEHQIIKNLRITLNLTEVKGDKKKPV